MTTLDEAANTYQVYGCFLSISAGATVTVINSEFLNGYASIGGFIYVAGDSKLSLQSTNFERGYSTSDGGAIYISGFKELSILNCIFSDNTAIRYGSDIYSVAGTTKITDSSFEMEPNPTSIYLYDGNFVGKNITISNLVPTNMDLIYEIKGGGIYAGDMDSFTLESSMIQNLNFAEKGGALYLETPDSGKAKAIPVDPAYSVTSCTFSSNKAHYGGAVYIKNVEYVKFTSSTFTNNSAIQEFGYGGDGGAIYYDSSDLISKCEFTSGNRFTNSYASVSGGALYWDYINPVNYGLATYSGNSALKYGSDFA